MLFLSALAVWQQDVGICSGLSFCVNSLVQLSPRPFASGPSPGQAPAVGGPAASPSIFPSGVFGQLLCSPPGPRFPFRPFAVCGGARSFWNVWPAPPLLPPAEELGLSALVIKFDSTYGIRSTFTPLLAWPPAPLFSLVRELPLPPVLFFGPSPGRGVCNRALITSVHTFAPCLGCVQARVVCLFQANPRCQLW